MVTKKTGLLLKGDTVDLIAPGSGVLKRQVKQAGLIVKDLGYSPKTDGNFIRSGTVLKTNASLLTHVLGSSVSKAVWCLRGGYGCQKLLKELKLHGLSSRPPKLLIGYSDVTILQMHLYDTLSWPSLHFPVLAHMYRVSLSPVKQFQALASGKLKTISFKKLSLINTLKIKSVKPSVLLGGNMTLIQTSIGNSLANSRFF